MKLRMLKIRNNQYPTIKSRNTRHKTFNLGSFFAHIKPSDQYIHKEQNCKQFRTTRKLEKKKNNDLKKGNQIKPYALYVCFSKKYIFNHHIVNKTHHIKKFSTKNNLRQPKKKKKNRALKKGIKQGLMYSMFVSQENTHLITTLSTKHTTLRNIQQKAV